MNHHQIYLRTIAFVSCCVATSVALAAGSSAVKPVDPEVIAKKFKPGVFKAETTEVAADGTASHDSSAMCMNAESSNLLVLGLLGGVAGCEPLSTHEDKRSISVSANCPATTNMGANFYAGAMRWSADGKQIQFEAKRTELSEGKPTDKVLQLISVQLAHQGTRCP